MPKLSLLTATIRGEEKKIKDEESKVYFYIHHLEFIQQAKRSGSQQFLPAFLFPLSALCNNECFKCYAPKSILILIKWPPAITKACGVASVAL